MRGERERGERERRERERERERDERERERGRTTRITQCFGAWLLDQGEQTVGVPKLSMWEDQLIKWEGRRLIVASLEAYHRFAVLGPN